MGNHPSFGELAVIVAGFAAGEQPCRGVLGAVVGRGAAPANPLERVAAAAAMPVGFLLDSTAHVMDAGEPESHHLKRVEHPHRGGQTGPTGLRRSRETGPTPLLLSRRPSRYVAQIACRTILIDSDRVMTSIGHPRCRSTIPVANPELMSSDAHATARSPAYWAPAGRRVVSRRHIPVRRHAQTPPARPCLPTRASPWHY